MDRARKKVAIELRTVIDDHGQMEYNHVKESGIFHQKGNLDVLTFEEKMEDDAVIKNLITIQTDKVSIKRTGIVTMNQQFRTNQTTENVYQHPHGKIHMETFTNRITYHRVTRARDGVLIILYTVKLNSQDEREHKLELVYSEED